MNATETKMSVSVERFNAWAAVEFAVATGEPHTVLYEAVEAATRAAYDEGKAGCEWVPYRKKGAEAPADAAPPKKERYCVSPADGFWMAVKSGQVTPPGPPFIVYREGEGVDTRTLGGILAICPTKEAADLVKAALNASRP